MFCPKCGNADQEPDTYCRSCGIYLPDLNRPTKKQTPQDHLKANTSLIILSGIVSLVLAVWLYTFLLRDLSIPSYVNYIVAGLLLANFGWQVQTFIRTRMLKKHFVKRDDIGAAPEIFLKDKDKLKPMSSDEALRQSVVDRTTQKLNRRN